MIKAKLFPGVVLALASVVAVPTWAHGNQNHGKPAGEIKLEQKDWGIGAPSSKATRTIVGRNGSVRGGQRRKGDA
jgi:hypothetical protein